MGRAAAKQGLLTGICEIPGTETDKVSSSSGSSSRSSSNKQRRKSSTSTEIRTYVGRGGQGTLRAGAGALLCLRLESRVSSTGQINY